MRTILVTNIKWDTDDESPMELGLPTEVEVELPDRFPNYNEDIEEFVSDYLSDTYGFCHCGFTMDCD